MKAFILALCFMTGVIFSSTAQKFQVTAEEAKNVAIEWIKANFPFFPTSGHIAEKYDENGNTIVYEYITDSVSVLMSGHRSCRAIIAWTTSGISLLEDDEHLPPGLRSWTNAYTDQVKDVFVKKNEGFRCENSWDELANKSGVSPKNTRDEYVNSLIKTQWGQSVSNDGLDRSAYNYEMPGITGHCDVVPVGCGGVALAQILNYWQAPIVYNKCRQFDWCNMADKLYVDNENYVLQRKAIAFLMQECAWAIESQIRCDATFSEMKDILAALRTKFGFNTNARYLKKRNFDDTEWVDMLKENIRQGWPVIYRGSGSQNHIFICDGYAGDGTFGFNWGSVGNYRVWFYLDRIVPGSQDFSNDQEAIFDVYPVPIDMAHRICDFVLNLGDFYSANPRLLQENNIFDITPRTMTTLTSASASSPAAWRTIPAGASAEYVAHEEVILEDGFEAEWGSEFEAWIEPCAKCGESRGDGSATRTLTQREDSLASDSTEATYMAPGHSEFTIHNSEFKIGLFPNPTDGPLAMETDGEAESVVVYDAKGLPVGGWRLVGRSGRSLQLDVAALRPGAYILSVRTAAGTSTARFVRR